MGTQQVSARTYASSRNSWKKSATCRGGVIHESVRHTTRFTVIGNHLAQHDALSLVAIGLGVHIQSLPDGTPVGIKDLAARFPEGATRIAGALRELEVHGYLRRTRERTREGHIVTRTVFCNQPGRTRTPQEPASRRPAQRRTAPEPLRGPTPREDAPETRHPAHRQDTPAPRHPAHREDAPAPRHSTHRENAPAPRHPTHRENAPEPRHTAHREDGKPRRAALPAVPQPVYATPDLLRTALGVLSGLRRTDPRLLISATDAEHLLPGVAAWLERDLTPEDVHRALTTALPPEPLRRPAALLAHRLTARLPPLPPFAPGRPEPPKHPLQNCDVCDRAHRAPEPGTCGACRTRPAPAPHP
ncbi:helix-turn-helix domain-containing protein [Streptomyces sp. NPDC001744]|uniref:helix-turn-helix domain-containing protein n=1 Tax=Streptomyces sp. NPDC001744 TaxID=3364606 RepID=UPI003673983B